jgi:hypothetical protein
VMRRCHPAVGSGWQCVDLARQLDACLVQAGIQLYYMLGVATMIALPRLFELTSPTATTRQFLLVVSKGWPDGENVRLVGSYHDHLGTVSLWTPTHPHWRIHAGQWVAGPQCIAIKKALLAHSDAYGVVGYDPLAEIPQEGVKALEASIQQGLGFLRWLDCWGGLNVALHLGWREYLLVVDTGYNGGEVHHDY